MIGPHRLWILFFGFWIVLLSGVLNSRLSTPGLFQLMEHRALLADRQRAIQNLSVELQSLRVVQKNLENNPNVQLREIRKTLGYVAPDELLFEY